MTICAGFAGLLLTSCHPVIFDDLPECVPDYRVRLSYDRNMDFKERVNEVDAAEIYAFDSNGSLMEIGLADRKALEANDWTVPMKLKRFETYNLVVWGGLTDDSPFALGGTKSVEGTSDLTVHLGTNEKDEEGNNVSRQRLPPLFHANQSVSFSAEEGYEEQKVSLTKDTNTIEIILRKTDGTIITLDEVEVKIIDSNGVITYDNTLEGNDDIHYHAVSMIQGDYAKPDGNGGTLDETTKGIKAEIHLSRLMQDSGARLVIIEKETKKVLVDQKLLDLLEESKSHETPDMDMQEYLDREDKFNVDITFHVDAYYMHFNIYVNNWATVEYDVEWD